MLERVKVEDVMFLDIETVPQESDYSKIPESMQQLWDKKSAYFRSKEESASDVYQRAGIYAEFGKIVCISVGIITKKEGVRIFRVKSFAGHDESVLLRNFGQMLSGFAKNASKNICGHNSKEFDFPYIARRMLINGIKLPKILDVAGKKPWTVKFLDTMDLWKFGDYKHYTSLNLLTQIFNIPSPKDDIDGSMVASVYYDDGDIDRIANYCEKDVLATAQLFLRLKGEPILEADSFLHVD